MTKDTIKNTIELKKNVSNLREQAKISIIKQKLSKIYKETKWFIGKKWIKNMKMYLARHEIQ